MKNFKNIALIILIMATIIVLGTCITYNYLISPVSKSETIIEVEIPKNTSSRDIAKILKNNKLIRDDKAFLVYLKIFKVNNIKAGYYDFTPNMGVKKIVKSLQNGSLKNPNEVKLTFQEGITIRDVAKVISNKTNNEYDNVIAKTNDVKYLDQLINKYWFITEEVKNTNLYYGLEGYLFPDTYYFENKEVSIEIIFEKMLDEMDKVLSSYKEKIAKQNKSVHDILSLASIVEKESATNKDRTKVASVMLNRIEAKMPLGSDVTTLYAWKFDKKKAMNKKEFQIASPYNTRLTDGSMNGKLPVGPICLLSKESIDAALNPETTDYLYFIANIKTLEVFYFKDYSGFEAKKEELKSVNGGF